MCNTFIDSKEEFNLPATLRYPSIFDKQLVAESHLLGFEYLSRHFARFLSQSRKIPILSHRTATTHNVLVNAPSIVMCSRALCGSKEGGVLNKSWFFCSIMC